MSNRAEISNLEDGNTTFLGGKFFPQDLINTCLARDPKGILFGPSNNGIPSLPLSSTEQGRLRTILDDRIRGKKLLLCSGGADPLVPYDQSIPFLEVFKDAVTGWYADGGITVDDRVYEGIGHKFSADMVTDAVMFLVNAVAEGPRRKAEGGGKDRAKI